MNDFFDKLLGKLYDASGKTTVFDSGVPKELPKRRFSLNVPNQIADFFKLPAALNDAEQRGLSYKHALLKERNRGLSGFGVDQQPTPTATPMPTPQVTQGPPPQTITPEAASNPIGAITPAIEKVLGIAQQASPREGIINAFVSQLGSMNPARNNPESYFPILNYLDLLQQKEQEYQRPGLAALLALQSLFESTGGRATNGNNLFGALPPGGVSFDSPLSSIEYQLGPNMLGGGANPNMNILSGKEGQPITPEEIKRLYTSYDPPGAYLSNILDYYSQIMGY